MNYHDLDDPNLTLEELYHACRVCGGNLDRQTKEVPPKRKCTYCGTEHHRIRMFDGHAEWLPSTSDT